MSEHTIFLAPSEAFLLGLVLGEWQEYHEYVAGLHRIQRDVCGHMYRDLPTFFDVLRNRLRPFVPNGHYFELQRKEDKEQSDEEEGHLEDDAILWVDAGGNLEFGVSPGSPLTVFRRYRRLFPGIDTSEFERALQSRDNRTYKDTSQRIDNVERVESLQLHPDRPKFLFEQLCYRLHSFAALPHDLFVLIKFIASIESTSDWARVCDAFASGRVWEEYPVHKDVRPKIEATLAPSLDGYDAEVRAGHCAGRLLAAIELNRLELPGNAGEWTGDIQAGLDSWQDSPEILDRFTSEQLAEYVRWIESGEPDALKAIRDLQEPRPHLEDERPPIILGGKIRERADVLLNLPLVRACPHAITLAERIREHDDLVAEIEWYSLSNADELGVEWDDDSVCGSYDDPAGQIFDDEGEFVRETLRAIEMLTWTAIGALLGDMAERDRAFSEEDARKVLPRNLTPFGIDGVGDLRIYLPTARKLLALGPSPRGANEAFVVKTLATSLESIMESAFPRKFPVRDSQIPNMLQEILRDTHDERHQLASTLLYLWRDYRHEAAHRGPDRPYSHSEARAIYSLYELAVELHDRIVESRARDGGTSDK